MKIKIWRRARLLWCWRCPVCQKTWRNRQAVAHVRPIRSSKYWPLWSSEVNVPSAWERCVLGAHTHIKKYHAASVDLADNRNEER